MSSRTCVVTLVLKRCPAQPSSPWYAYSRCDGCGIDTQPPCCQTSFVMPSDSRCRWSPCGAKPGPPLPPGAVAQGGSPAGRPGARPGEEDTDTRIDTAGIVRTVATPAKMVQSRKRPKPSATS